MMRFPLLLLFVALVPAVVVAEIYKSVDENGNVVYSDRPSPGAQQIEKKIIPAISTNVPEVDFSTTGNAAADNMPYDSIRIVSPENETAVRENAGNLSVSVALEPELKQTHAVILELDGKKVAKSRSPEFQLQNLDRGEHTLTVAVVDGNGTEILRSGLTRFTLMRSSVLHPQSDNLAPNINAPVGTPTNPPTVNPPGQNPVNPSFPGPTPTNPPKPRAPTS